MEHLFFMYWSLIPPFRLDQYFIIFLTECLQSRKEKIKTVHLFLNSAKSSEAGKRMEKSKVCAVMSPHESSRPLAAFISDGDPFESHLTSPALSCSPWWERGAGAFCQHECPCPFWVTTWEMGTHRNLRVSPKVAYIWNPSSGTEY